MDPVPVLSEASMDSRAFCIMMCCEQSTGRGRQVPGPQGTALGREMVGLSEGALQAKVRG